MIPTVLSEREVLAPEYTNTLDMVVSAPEPWFQHDSGADHKR